MSQYNVFHLISDAIEAARADLEHFQVRVGVPITEEQIDDAQFILQVVAETSRATLMDDPSLNPFLSEDEDGIDLQSIADDLNDFLSEEDIVDHNLAACLDENEETDVEGEDLPSALFDSEESISPDEIEEDEDSGI